MATLTKREIATNRSLRCAAQETAGARCECETSRRSGMPLRHRSTGCSRSVNAWISACACLKPKTRSDEPAVAPELLAVAEHLTDSNLRPRHSKSPASQPFAPFSLPGRCWREGTHWRSAIRHRRGRAGIARCNRGRAGRCNGNRLRGRREEATAAAAGGADDGRDGNRENGYPFHVPSPYKELPLYRVRRAKAGSSTCVPQACGKFGRSEYCSRRRLTSHSGPTVDAREWQ